MELWHRSNGFLWELLSVLVPSTTLYSSFYSPCYVFFVHFLPFSILLLSLPAFLTRLSFSPSLLTRSSFQLNETYTTLIPALLMGNPVVLKTPRTGCLCHVPTIELFKVTKLLLLWLIFTLKLLCALLLVFHCSLRLASLALAFYSLLRLSFYLSLPLLISCYLSKNIFPPGVVNIIHGSGREIFTPIMKVRRNFPCSLLLCESSLISEVFRLTDWFSRHIGIYWHFEGSFWASKSPPTSSQAPNCFGSGC